MRSLDKSSAVAWLVMARDVNGLLAAILMLHFSMREGPHLTPHAVAIDAE